MEKGDIIIDGGNSEFGDTTRRVRELREKGLLFVGSGVSGGEDGARYGPSLMPGGSSEAWPHIKAIFQGIAAKSGTEPCCDWVSGFSFFRNTSAFGTCIKKYVTKNIFVSFF